MDGVERVELYLPQSRIPHREAQGTARTRTSAHYQENISKVCLVDFYF